MATLHRPEDIPRIAQLLGDSAEAPAELMLNNQGFSEGFFTGAAAQEQWDRGLDLARSWELRRVQTYACVRLILLTGEDFSAKDFSTWWAHNQNPLHRVWYWQQRVLQGFAECVVACPDGPAR